MPIQAEASPTTQAHPTVAPTESIPTPTAQVTPPTQEKQPTVDPKQGNADPEKTQSNTIRLVKHEKSGDLGTVWGVVQSELSKSGYDQSLSPEQLAKLQFLVTEQTLKDNGISWDEARHLAVGTPITVAQPTKVQIEAATHA